VGRPNDVPSDFMVSGLCVHPIYVVKLAILNFLSVDFVKNSYTNHVILAESGECLLTTQPQISMLFLFNGHLMSLPTNSLAGIETSEQADLSCLLPLPLPKVSDENIGDDRLGDEEWNLISSARYVWLKMAYDKISLRKFPVLQ
jgi:hypothetical protein